MLRVISLGAGVQSTALALMAACGEIGPMPDCAVFADTGWEPGAVYDHLVRLEGALPFPVIRVTAGNLREAVLGRVNTTGGRFAAVPWHIRMTNGDETVGRRQCTKEYKLRPIQREVVARMGGRRPRGGCEMWIGISTDEAMRVKASQVAYIVNRWPLIEMRKNRGDCRAWLERAGWSAPRSACIGCPFRSAEEWKALTAAELADAIEVDEAIRHQSKAGEQFANRRMVPLSEVDLSDQGQIDLFGNECEGMCGV
jgi:hypothetical protein